MNAISILPTTDDARKGAYNVSSETSSSSQDESKTLDAAEIFLRDNDISHGHIKELLDDSVINKRLLRKVDWRIMPLLMGTFLLQFIDKQSMSYGAVFDLFESTHISSHQYSWLASLFYFGYLVSEWPSSYLAQHLPTGTVISCFTIAWGSLLMITAATHNFVGLAVCRILLGVFEAPVTPCFMMIVGMWYTRKEQPARAGMFYCCNGLGSMFGGILFYAVGQTQGFPVWRAILLLCGGVTVLWGIVLLIFLPNNIITAKRFTTEEKALLIGRGQMNQTGIYNRNIKRTQVKEALVDPQIWILFWFALFKEVVNGGLSNFGKLIIKGVVRSPTMTVVFGIPAGAFAAFFVFTGPYLASKFRNIRTYIMAAYICPSIIGISLMWKLPRSNKYGLLLSYYIVGSFVASLVVTLQLPATNVGGYTKRVTGTAFVFLAYCIGNIIGPHAFIASEAPTYPTGCKLMLSCSIAQVCLAFALRALLVRRNRIRDAMGAPDQEDVEQDKVRDLTDFENVRFRYSY